MACRGIVGGEQPADAELAAGHADDDPPLAISGAPVSRRGSPAWSEKVTGRKLALCLEIASPGDYPLIAQERRQVLHHARRDDLGGAFLSTIAAPDPSGRAA